MLAAWRKRGYKIALWRDSYYDVPDADYVRFNTENPATGDMSRSYPGYATAVNVLAYHILRDDHSCDWIVTGGDDTLPDPNHTAEEIAAQCSDHFGYDAHYSGRSLAEENLENTFGVMQPTGDRFAGGSIDRIAGSPWLGREWCLRANGGRGPFWPEFTHMFGDECLKHTAEKLGVYWARPDLTHFHKHFMRESEAIDSEAVVKPKPPHLEKWNTPEHWVEMKAIFQRLEAEDFKSCLPL